jgi:hypothetical protein
MSESKETTKETAVSIPNPSVSFGGFIDGVINSISENEASAAGFPYWDYDAGSELRGLFLGVDNIDVKNIDAKDPNAPERKRLPCVRIKTGEFGGYICAASTLVQDCEHIPPGFHRPRYLHQAGGEGQRRPSNFQVIVVAGPDKVKKLLGEKYPAGLMGSGRLGSYPIFLPSNQ